MYMCRGVRDADFSGCEGACVGKRCVEMDAVNYVQLD